MAASLNVTSALIPRGQDEIDRLHAFRVLMHAEVQAYVQAIAEQVMDVTEKQCTTNARLTHAGHHLVAFQSLYPLANTRSSNKATYPDFSPQILKATWPAASNTLIKAIEAHRKRVMKENNGIKPGNLNRVLIPLGFRDVFFTQRFRDKMNELGEQRGEVAHGSGTGVTLVPTGAGELKRFYDIKQGLSDMDRYAPRLLIPVWR
ncbi:HEPN domain-containing protein [Streptomyces collinus]